MAKFESGNPGKPKGATNLLNRTVKETVLAVFNDLQNEPKHSLTAFAKKNPTAFYNIAAKLIPTEIQAKVNGVMNHFVIEPDAGNDPIED